MSAIPERNDSYLEFLNNKIQHRVDSGFEPSLEINPMLYEFQSDILKWALRKGRAALFLDCGTGKGQPYGSQILTPTGYVNIESLTVGCKVIASDGKAYNVSGVYPKQELATYRFHFSDGVSYVVDIDHLHIVRTNNDRQRNKKWRVMSTDDLLKCGNLRYGADGKSRNYDIPVVNPVAFAGYYDGLISPYVMGALLGDGYLKGNICISSADQSILQRVRCELPYDMALIKKKGSLYDYRIHSGCTGNKRHPFRQEFIDLGLYGKLSHEKFIPNDFLVHSSTEFRIMLLQGLMDTDGYIMDYGTSQYYTVSKQLANNVMFLVRSLGGIPTLSMKKGMFQGKRHRDCYTVTFSLKTYNPFWVEYKAKKWNPNPRDNGRWIDRIEYEGQQKTICISVDSPDQSYVAEHFIVTHNTPIQLEWARHVIEHTDAPVLIFAPLAVSKQTVREGQKFDIEVNICREQSGTTDGVNITNYEMLHKFDLMQFSGIVLDESSILKSFSGKFRQAITEGAADIPYKLCCTATPAPNDYMELGNHAEFLNICSYSEMLAKFFVNDASHSASWRLKGHAQDEFWRWLATWGILMRSPGQYGYDNKLFQLPAIRYIEHVIESTEPPSDMLFHMPALTLNERRSAKRDTIRDRTDYTADIINQRPADESWVIWCNLNDESKYLTEAIDGAVEVKGSDKSEHKEWALEAFATGEIKRLVTKPSIAGFGMNWQICYNMAFVGLSDSFEQFYQATRRCWRFGQEKPVDVHIVTADREISIKQNIEGKEARFKEMFEQAVASGLRHFRKELGKDKSQMDEQYISTVKEQGGWKMIYGDCVEEIKTIADESIHFSIFSPPFASLYVFSDSKRDMANVTDEDEFVVNFKFLASELYRVMMPGRSVALHCMDIPAMLGRDNYVGLKDFPAMLRQVMQDVGFIYYSRITIWKSPVIEVVRTKTHVLLHRQLKKDSGRCRVGMPDYVLIMRKPGENLERITHTDNDFPVDEWAKVASPVWWHIRQTNTLNTIKPENDERHISALQLDTIRDLLRLYSNPGDVVLSPFAGIGSEGYQSIKMGRRFVGIELKREYFDVALRNLQAAEIDNRQNSLFNSDVKSSATGVVK